VIVNNSNNNSLNTQKTTTYDVGNPCHDTQVCQYKPVMTHKCGSINQS